MYSEVKITVLVGEDIVKDLTTENGRLVHVEPSLLAVRAYQYLMATEIAPKVTKILREGNTTVIEMDDEGGEPISVMVTITDKMTELERN